MKNRCEGKSDEGRSEGSAENHYERMLADKHVQVAAHHNH